MLPAARKDLETSFVDSNGCRHPGWHLAEVVLEGRLWGPGMDGVPAAAKLALREAFEGNGGIPKCVITSPQGALDVSPGMSGRVTAAKGFVHVDFNIDWGGLDVFAVPVAREMAGSEEGARNLLRDAFDWIHDGDASCVIQGMDARYGTNLNLSARMASDSFGEAMRWVGSCADEILAANAERRAWFARRMAESAAQVAPPAPGPR